jgi:hypothetical protein
LEKQHEGASESNRNGTDKERRKKKKQRERNFGIVSLLNVSACRTIYSKLKKSLSWPLPHLNKLFDSRIPLFIHDDSTNLPNKLVGLTSEGHRIQLYLGSDLSGLIEAEKERKSRESEIAELK